MNIDIYTTKVHDVRLGIGEDNFTMVARCPTSTFVIDMPHTYSRAYAFNIVNIYRNLISLGYITTVYQLLNVATGFQDHSKLLINERYTARLDACEENYGNPSTVTLPLMVFGVGFSMLSYDAKQFLTVNIGKEFDVVLKASSEIPNSVDRTYKGRLTLRDSLFGLVVLCVEVEKDHDLENAIKNQRYEICPDIIYGISPSANWKGNIRNILELNGVTLNPVNIADLLKHHCPIFDIRNQLLEHTDLETVASFDIYDAQAGKTISGMVTNVRLDNAEVTILDANGNKGTINLTYDEKDYYGLPLDIWARRNFEVKSIVSNGLGIIVSNGTSEIDLFIGTRHYEQIEKIAHAVSNFISKAEKPYTLGELYILMCSSSKAALTKKSKLRFDLLEETGEQIIRISSYNLNMKEHNNLYTIGSLFDELESLKQRERVYLSNEDVENSRKEFDSEAFLKEALSVNLENVFGAITDFDMVFEDTGIISLIGKFKVHSNKLEELKTSSDIAHCIVLLQKHHHTNRDTLQQIVKLVQCNSEDFLRHKESYIDIPDINNVDYVSVTQDDVIKMEEEGKVMSDISVPKLTLR